MTKCSDCGTKCNEHFVDYHYPNVAVCEPCAVKRREIEPDSFWFGMEWQRDVPNVIPILMGTFSICAAIICLILLLSMVP